MRNFLSVSLLVALVFSLPFTSYPGESENITSRDAIIPWKPIFDTNFKKGLYRAAMDIGKNHLSGFVFIKKVNDTSYRILFNNEIGMNIFDFEFLPDEFIVHGCFPSLDRKSMLQLLKNDFRVLLFTNHGIRKIIPVKSGKENASAFKIRSGSGRWKFHVSDSSGSILFIGSAHKFISRTRIQVDHLEGEVNEVSISNPVIGLSITLKLISP